ncbi:hypothetical protein H632_c1434p2 [Helicosporidium sp. ATCC 50920]|nr:hypothetical protein H632_c1434p2 [Helicosporidium sp. ATCC 50920]|eukprot:KDD74282.1 hypothetical protein H632_c1434p2 [Helicosporidium sp. ATCC 50920]
MVILDKEGLRVTFYPARVPEEKGVSRIRAVVENSGAQPIAAFSLQAAVPKFMQLRLDAASAADLPARGGKITQTLHVTNSQQGARPLVMRLRVSYSRAGEERVEQVEVDGFPKDL